MRRWCLVLIAVLIVHIHLIIMIAYSIFMDIEEANARAFLLAPGTVSLLYLFLPAPKIRIRFLAMCCSIAITYYFNQWHLADGNKILVAGMQLVLLTLCLAQMSRSKGWLLMSAVLFLLSIGGVVRQYWLEAQFNKVDIYIVNDGRSCGSSGRCFEYFVEKGRDLGEERQLLFTSEEYVNIHFSTSRQIPVVYFDGAHNSSAEYILCDGRLKLLNQQADDIELY